MFVIKGTYKQGENKGKSFYLGKGGIYISSAALSDIELFQTYNSHKVAKMIATKFNSKNNEDERRYPELTIPIYFSTEKLKTRSTI